MHSSEAEQLLACTVCDQDVSSADRTYPFGDGQILCFGCAVHRGGIYDEARDHWDRDPDILDLLERPMHA